MKLILIRHGETDWVVDRRYQGSTDIPLNATGKQQAKLTAQVLKKEKPFAIYASPMTRVRQTAAPIAKACRKRLILDPRLKEVSFGEWEGYPFQEVWDRFPKDASTWYGGSWKSKPTGGESLRSLERRVSSFFNELKKKHAARDGTCMIVSHGGPIRMFLIWALKISPQIFWSFRVDLASLNIFRIKADAHEVVLLNSQAHLNGLVQGGKPG